jgi:hypothetical protein
VWSGLSCLLASAVLLNNSVANRLALIALEAFAIAVVFGFIEAFWIKRWTELPRSRSEPLPGDWWWAVLVAMAIPAIAAQTWFHAGSVIAGGDITPPVGSAWIARLFDQWTWSGWNLGGPSALEQQLPWAAVLGAVESLRGSPELAQRVMYTVCFAGTGGGCLGLLAAFGVRPLAAIVGALSYSFSTFVVSNAVPGPVFIAGLALLPALMAVVLASARRKLRTRTGILLLGLSAPILGYVFANPALLGMVVLPPLCTPLLAGWLYGRRAAYRGLFVVAAALPLVLTMSAFWIVPSIYQLHSAAVTKLASISDWNWTQGRATVRNAFWLNTTWFWAHPEFIPFASAYDSLPLSILRFVPAIIAFSALALNDPATAFRRRSSAVPLRMTGLTSGIALAIIFLSTGTNPPGNVVFDTLYSLKFGWLLREPGRFLAIVALMYAILIAFAVDRLSTWRWLRSSFGSGARRYISVASAMLVGLLVTLPGLPLLTGAFVPDHRPGSPPLHVVVPPYWLEMTSYVNRMPVSGAVLVLPPDDFYQMPYRWGYSGSDTFITDLTSRAVLIPTGDTYFPATAQLLATVNLAATSILAHDWQLEDRLLRALGSPLVLVRGDIDQTSPGRHILTPSDLSNALQEAPNFQLVHTSGPLKLYRLVAPPIGGGESFASYATVDTASPDLRVLASLPPQTPLVTEPPSTGVPSLQEIPDVSHWTQVGSQLKWVLPDEPGRTYGLIRLDSTPGIHPLDELVGHPPSPEGISVTRSNGTGSASYFEITLSGTSILANGGFDAGLWAPVENCADYHGAEATPYLNATVIPVGGPAGGPFLRLATRLDSACEKQDLKWQKGPVLITMSFRHVLGAAPRFCLYETGPERCANLPLPVPSTGSWTTYRAAYTPDPGTRGLNLVLYADSYRPNSLTQNDYADVGAVELGSLPEYDVLASPVSAAKGSRLVVEHSSYSGNWQGPSGSRHVMVDGLTNGWVLSDSRSFIATYQPDGPVRLSFVASTLAVMITLGLAASLIPWQPLLSSVRRRAELNSSRR